MCKPSLGALGATWVAEHPWVADRTSAEEAPSHSLTLAATVSGMSWPCLGRAFESMLSECLHITAAMVDGCYKGGVGAGSFPESHSLPPSSPLQFLTTPC